MRALTMTPIESQTQRKNTSVRLRVLNRVIHQSSFCRSPVSLQLVRTCGVVCGIVGAIGLHTNVSLADKPQLTELFPFSCQIGSTATVDVVGTGLGREGMLVFSAPAVESVPIGDGRFRITCPANHPAGDCDVWMMTDGQLTNPVRFVVFDGPCLREHEPNDFPETAQELPLPGAVDCHVDKSAEVDWFQFIGKAGETVTITARSRTLDGSVEPALSVYGPSGQELVHSAGHQREPTITLSIRQSGPHRVRVVERAYRKEEGAFYQLRLETGPRILGAFPNLIHSRSEAHLTVYGSELSGGHPLDLPRFAARYSDTLLAGRLAELQIPLTLSDWPASTAGFGPWQSAATAFPDAVNYRHSGAGGQALIRRTDQTVVVENEAAEQPQRVEIPALLNGRFLQLGDVDRFVFAGVKDESLRIDLYGERLGLRMDLDAAIIDSQGQTEITFPDAKASKGLPAVVAADSLDVSAIWKVPADGNYQLVGARSLRRQSGGSRSHLCPAPAPSTPAVSCRRPAPPMSNRPRGSRFLAGNSVCGN